MVKSSLVEPRYEESIVSFSRTVWSSIISSEKEIMLLSGQYSKDSFTGVGRISSGGGALIRKSHPLAEEFTVSTAVPSVSGLTRIDPLWLLSSFRSLLGWSWTSRTHFFTHLLPRSHIN